MELIIRAVRGDISYDPDIIKLYAYQRLRGRRFRVESKLKFIEVEHGKYEPLEPFLEIETHQAQQLIDSLWDCGLRPSEGSGSAGAMKKIENHLEDMRKIAFHALKIQG